MALVFLMEKVRWASAVPVGRLPLHEIPGVSI